jgi:hypothetical protein
LTSDKPVYKLSLRAADGSLEILTVTDNHPFWVINKSHGKHNRKLAGWVPSAKLKPGMLVQTHDGKTLPVVSIVTTHKIQQTYNFTVADFHTYFVGIAKVWVHNSGNCPCGYSQKQIIEAGKEDVLKFQDYNQARNAALAWLESRGFRAEKTNIGKLGDTKGTPVGMKSADGKTGFRIEYDARNGAHINVFDGKEKGPHITFEASQKTVEKITKQFGK